MDLTAMWLAFPLLGVMSSPGPAVDPGAARSVVAILRETEDGEPSSHPVESFLLAHHLIELGVPGLAQQLLRPLVHEGPLRGAAFTAYARAAGATGTQAAAGRLLRIARHAPWDDVRTVDRPEVLFRVARAAVIAERLPEARGWARRVPAESTWHPYARFLLAQIEFALGRYPEAIAAARPLFDHVDAGSELRQRAAVLLGNMLTEIGLYGPAKDLLAWPAAGGPFAIRAARDRQIALALRSLEQGQIESAEERLGRVQRSIDEQMSDLERVSDPAAAPVEDLRKAWPPETRFRQWRLWAVARAEEARRSGRWSLGRVLRTFWETLPPVVVYRLLTARSELVHEARALGRESRFFFAPDRRLSRALTAAALLEETGGDSCGDRAARALRYRIAASLLDRDPEPGLDEIRRLSRDCGNPSTDPPLRSSAVDAAIRAVRRRALELRNALRHQQLALDSALARARLSTTEVVR